MLCRRLAAFVTPVALLACAPARGPVTAGAPPFTSQQAAPAAGAISASAGGLSRGGPSSDTVEGLLAEGFVALEPEEGVAVYRREVLPGVELAAVADFAASPERVRRLLLDYPSHPRWQKRLSQNRVLAQGPDFLDVYQRLNLPILDDRDFTVHVTWGHEGDVLWMRFEAANERGPGEVSGVVRVSTHQGHWRLAPTAGGEATHAFYRFHMDLAGSLPSWMGKGRAADEVVEMFVAMRRELLRYP